MKRLISRIVLLTFFGTAAAQAQQRDFDPASVHWAYSAYFGTGWYRVSDDREVYVLRYTHRWNLREASIDEHGDRSLGIHFKFPLTAGLEILESDRIPDLVDPDNLSTLSITPGVDIEIPLNARWSLRPYAALGWGSILDRGESSWIYWTGIKSRYAFQSGRLDWALLNTIGYVGHSPEQASSDEFWPLMIGFEFDYPISDLRLGGDDTMLHWHLTYTSFERNLDFIVDGLKTDPITDEWELAVALAKQDKKIKIWFMSFERLGIGYRRNTDGNLRGITFVFRSVFDL